MSELTYQWADISPKRAVLYEIRTDNPRNKKIAEVFFNEWARDGFVARLHDENNPLVRLWIKSAIHTKQEAMEVALAELVTKRLDKANSNT